MKYRKGNWNLLIAFVIIAIIAVLQWNRWGVKILQDLNDGDFFFHGGPSLFYPTALFPSLVAIGYLISFLCSLGKVEISRTKDSLNISEKRGFIYQQISIPYGSLTSKFSSNAQIGWSAIGIIPLVLSSYYLYIDGISLLTYHAVYGFGVDTGIYYILQATGNIIAIVSVLFMSPGEITIRSTQTDRIIVQLPIIWSYTQKNLVQSQLVEELDIPIKRPTDKKNTDNILIFTYGIILIATSILSRIFLIFSNEVLRIICVHSGLLFITYGIKNWHVARKKGLWFSMTKNHQFTLMGRIWTYLLSGVVIITTLLTVINNFIYISNSYNMISTIFWNIGFFLIIVIPGVWIYFLPLMKKKRSQEYLST